MTNLRSYESSPAAKEGEGPIHWNTLCRERGQLVTTAIEGVHTVYDVMQYIVRTYKDTELMAYRKVLGVVEEEKYVTKSVGGKQEKQKKVWKYSKLSKFYWYTAKEMGNITAELGSGLAKLGLAKGANISIYAPTSAEWQLFCHGCFHQGITISTAYDTLGEGGLTHALRECEVEAIFTKTSLLHMIHTVLEQVPSLRTIIYFGDEDDASQAQLAKLKEARPELQLVTYDTLREIGRQSPADPQPPAPQDLACVMYTSGSTGTPKGVQITHANMVATLGGAREVLKSFVQEGDSLLSYLPLAHVLQMAVELVLYTFGIKIGYGTPRSLTNQSVRECQGDLCEFQPTLLVGVPQVWDTIRKGVLATLNSSSPIVRTVFHVAYKAKWWMMQRGLPTGLLDRLVFKKVQAQTGGRLRFALSGGAGISRESQEFLSTTLCPIIQGYGMTETTGIIALMDPSCFELKVVGPPVPDVEVKLVDVKDTEYRAAEGRGEVWVRGASITPGYYKRDDLTREVLTEDKWFMTGDIGEWQPDGQLKLIDRKKNLVKLAHGEYIALEKLEAVYKTSMLVGNICVYADGEQTRPVALIMPDPKGLLHYAESNGLLQKLDSADHEHDIENLAGRPEVHDAVLKSCLDAAKQNSLVSAETLQDVYVVPDEWTPQNDMLTAAQKLNRNAVVKKYRSQIDRMYASGN
ncbi:long-chain fatty acid-CoA ligase [Tieghemiomyces parasiticus]|uniref:Long-chain fatty acid-CoA ligase n=1 Tax=Tieghemiomyces parasiticus TaxID=78921 RepID=A0A9W8DKX4_9FUNG|nr:long-chain fatty acid-CoA ligase [Tieghemiomyces parasiticus]